MDENKESNQTGSDFENIERDYSLDFSKNSNEEYLIEENVLATKPKISKKKTITTSSVLSVISAIVGCFGGYVLFGMLNPEQDVIVVEKGKLFDKDKIEKALAEGTVLETFKDKPHEVVNYACDDFANSSYTLTLGNGIVDAAAGVKQTIVSGTFGSPNGFFTQKVSSSSMVKTADRYYDSPSDNTILGYECNVESDWKDDPKSKTYTYDEYIQAFGKLNKGKYYCVDKTDTSDSEPIPEKFLTSSKEEYDACEDSTKHERNAVIFYSLTDNSVLAPSASSTIIEKTDTGYHVKLDLNVSYAVSFVTVQMKATGRLKSRPLFTSCYLTFELSDKLELISSNFHDEYRVNTGGLVTNATSNLQQQYFKSENSTFVNGTKEVTVVVPQITEQKFNAYELISEE